jgi:hypothetical protein
VVEEHARPLRLPRVLTQAAVVLVVGVLRRRPNDAAAPVPHLPRHGHSAAVLRTVYSAVRGSAGSTVSQRRQHRAQCTGSVCGRGW